MPPVFVVSYPPLRFLICLGLSLALHLLLLAAGGAGTGSPPSGGGVLQVHLYIPAPTDSTPGGDPTPDPDLAEQHGEGLSDTPAVPAGRRGRAPIRLGFAQPFSPFYPPALIGNQTRGQVSLTLALDQDGQVLQADIVDSRPAGVFDAAVLAALADNRIVVPAGFRAGRVRLDVIFDPYSLSSEASLSRP